MFKKFFSFSTFNMFNNLSINIKDLITVQDVIYTFDILVLRYEF